MPDPNPPPFRARHDRVPPSGVYKPGGGAYRQLGIDCVRESIEVPQVDLPLSWLYRDPTKVDPVQVSLPGFEPDNTIHVHWTLAAVALRSPPGGPRAAGGVAVPVLRAGTSKTAPLWAIFPGPYASPVVPGPLTPGGDFAALIWQHSAFASIALDQATLDSIGVTPAAPLTASLLVVHSTDVPLRIAGAQNPVPLVFTGAKLSVAELIDGAVTTPSPATIWGPFAL